MIVLSVFRSSSTALIKTTTNSITNADDPEYIALGILNLHGRLRASETSLLQYVSGVVVLLCGDRGWPGTSCSWHSKVVGDERLQQFLLVNRCQARQSLYVDDDLRQRRGFVLPVT